MPLAKFLLMLLVDEQDLLLVGVVLPLHEALQVLILCLQRFDMLIELAALRLGLLSCGLLIKYFVLLDFDF